ncbi:hypothetical protein BDN72DRAFT_864854 [Pluteus cervinus]|uniref:Uncharacterized protein n=1 Tax=Pluteus cervinus TaxID=181527 RepID=A0ACD3A2B4_9AGAR|nr:hypothetical protein BDN72DRAFT_864854 [Pluteus cervinus]
MSELTLTPLSIHEHCNVSQSILDDSHMSTDAIEDEFIKFNLTGVLEQEQCVVDPILERPTATEPIAYQRDYDSVIGLDEHVQISGDLTMFPASRPVDTLSTNVHIQHTFETQDGTLTVDIHKVPNFCVAKFGTHNSLRVFVPDAYNDEHPTPHLTAQQKADLYELGILPAIEHLMGPQAAEWPATYRDELFRSRGRNGQFAMQSKMLPAHLVPQFGDSLRHFLGVNNSTLGTGLVHHEKAFCPKAPQGQPSISGLLRCSQAPSSVLAVLGLP